MILLKTATETQKHNQQTSKKQFRSFPYDFTKNSNINQKQQQKHINITNILSKSNFVVFHMIVLKTATETQKHNQQTFKKQFRSFS